MAAVGKTGVAVELAVLRKANLTLRSTGSGGTGGTGGTEGTGGGLSFFCFFSSLSSAAGGTEGGRDVPAAEPGPVTERL